MTWDWLIAAASWTALILTLGLIADYVHGALEGRKDKEDKT